MKNEFLRLIEIFSSVQGETSFSGLPTTFIRLAACNLRCTWCDTTYSFGKGTPYSLDSILDEVKQKGCRYICVTGGEPLLQENVHPLMEALLEKGHIVSIETGGSLSTEKIDPRVKVILDIKCPGSGMEGKNDWSNINRLRGHDEVKFVLLDRKDYEYAKSKIHLLDKKVSEILLSPVFGALDPKELVKWILEDKLPVRLNLQIHKWIWSPETKGV